jgi:fluoroquinolone transport system permease protein
MSALGALFVTELKYQWRHGFIAAALIITIVWAALLSLVPTELRAFWFVIISMIDIASIGLMFGYGLGVLDRSQETVFALRLTPIKSWYTALARSVSLTILTSITLVTLAIATLSLQECLRLVPGIIMTAIVFSVSGVSMSRRFHSINQFIIFFSATGVVWVLPILYFANLLDSTFWIFLPSGGSALLFKNALEPASYLLISLAIVCQIGWLIVLFIFGERWASRVYDNRFGGY